MGWWLELSRQHNPAALWTAFVDAYFEGCSRAEIVVSAISWLVVFNEIRSIQFLLSYCQLEDELWRETFNRADELSARAVNQKLRILGEQGAMPNMRDHTR